VPIREGRRGRDKSRSQNGEATANESKLSEMKGGADKERMLKTSVKEGEISLVKGRTRHMVTKNGFAVIKSLQGAGETRKRAIREKKPIWGLSREGVGNRTTW